MWNKKSKANTSRESQSESHKLYGSIVKYSKATALANADMIRNEYRRKIQVTTEEIATTLDTKYYIDIEDLSEIKSGPEDYQFADGSRKIRIPTVKMYFLDSKIFVHPQMREIEIESIINSTFDSIIKWNVLLNEKKEFENLLKGWRVNGPK